MNRLISRTPLRAVLLTVGCALALALAAAPAEASVGANVTQYSGAVWTKYPGGYFLLRMDPVRSGDGANGLMTYWLQGVVKSWYCPSGSYANVYAQGDLAVYTFTPTSSSGTITGTAYDSCAGFDRQFQVTGAITDTGPVQTTTNCCQLGYNYLIAERWQYNGPGTATFQWDPDFLDQSDFTSMGSQYNNAVIGTDTVLEAP